MPENDTSTADMPENEKDPDDVELDVTDIVVGTVTTADAPEVNGFAATIGLMAGGKPLQAVVVWSTKGLLSVAPSS